MNRSRSRRLGPSAVMCLRRTRLLLAIWIGLAIASTASAALKFEFDYRYDSLGFFNDPARREALEAAGRIVNWYTDELDPINPSAGNTWTSFFSPPDGSNSIFLSDLPVAQDTMTIFVAGANLSGRLAQAIDTAPVGFGDEAWEATVSYRGQVGASLPIATDNGPMGGSISFNRDLTEVPWHFGTSTQGLDAQEFDFITVAMHELIHLMGLGISQSWSDHVNLQHQFTGTASVAAGSSTNPKLELDSAEAHWKSGTKSPWNGVSQEALLAPGIFPGRRAFPTKLDRAALRDIGWEPAGAGDADRDLDFDSTDLLAVFQAGLYETGKLASWSEGDWNDNGIFESGDLIEALQTGRYEQPPGAVANVPEPVWGGSTVAAVGALIVALRRRAK